MSGENTVTQGTPQQPNAMGGAPTTTSNVDGTLTAREVPQPSPQPTASNQPSPNPSASVPNAAPSNAAPVTHTPAPNQPSLHARMFDGILKTMSGGPIRVMQTDPTTGETRQVEVPQSRSSMGKAIVAAALTGLMTPPRYRDTPYGPAPDPQASMASAFQAGKGVVDDRKQEAQKVQDEAQTRKLMTIQNNAKLVQLMASSTHLNHQMLGDLNGNAQEFLKPFEEYDQNRTDDPTTPKAFLSRGLSSDEVLGGGHKLTDSNVIMDGTRQVMNPETKQYEEEPTYAVLNPDLKDIKLTEPVAKKLAEINSQYKDIHSLTGGNVRLPVQAYVSAMHDYNTVTQGEHILNTLGQEIQGKAFKPVDLTSAVRGDRQNMLRALSQVEQAVAAGNSPGQRPDNVMDALVKAPNGDKLLGLLGLTPQQADDFIQKKSNERIKATNEAKLGALSDKAKAPDEIVDALKDAAGALPDDQKATVLATLDNANGLTNAQARDAQKQIEGFQKSNQSDQTRKALAGGDPVVIKKTADDIVSGDLNQIEKIGTTRGDAKAKLVDAIHDEAVRRGLDSTKYTQVALDGKASMYNDYHSTKKSSTGAQIASFDAYLGHTAAAVDAYQRLEGKTLGLTRSPWINEKLSSLAKQVTNDPDWKAYQTSLVPVKHEIENFLSAGYAVKTEDAQAMKSVLDPNETPSRINAALRQLADTADVRLAALGRSYINTMDSNYENLMSADSVNTLKKLGIQSKALAYSQKLPRGWQGAEPQQMTDINMARRFAAAAGGDRQKTQDLAKANGWILN